MEGRARRARRAARARRPRSGLGEHGVRESPALSAWVWGGALRGTRPRSGAKEGPPEGRTHGGARAVASSSESYK